MRKSVVIYRIFAVTLAAVISLLPMTGCARSWEDTAVEDEEDEDEEETRKRDKKDRSSEDNDDGGSIIKFLSDLNGQAQPMEGGADPGVAGQAAAPADTSAAAPANTTDSDVPASEELISGSYVAESESASDAAYETEASGSGLYTLEGVEYYGVFVAAYKTEHECSDLKTDLLNKGFDAAVIYTPDYSGLNPQPYYVVSPGLFTSEAEAKDCLALVKAAGYNDAYVKFAGEYIGN
jgi:hypothetical protein